MKKIFDLIKHPQSREGGRPEFSLGFRLKIGDQETVCPLTRPFGSYEALENEMQTIQQDLSRVVEKARKYIRGDQASEGQLDFDAEMEPAQIWGLLSEIEDVDQFINIFNDLDESRRKEIAEHVLTHCNVFTGKASIFSSRYDNESGFME
jgi:hypothetical protein